MHGKETRAPWNEPLAVALMVEADGLVEPLRVSGLDPEIMSLAGEVVAAHTRRDMASVKVATFLITERAWELAKQNTNGRVA
jgi:hypothetical protein